MELFKLLGTIAVDTAEAMRKFKEISQEGSNTESKLGKVFSGIGKGAVVAGKAIASGLAVGAGAMVGLTTKALQASGDLEQNMGGAEAVFGELGQAISDMQTPMQTFNVETGKVETQMSSLEQVSKQAFQNMGLSQSDYLATANKMGALFKGAGFETQEALNLSSQAMQRAADVASIMGIDTEAAMEAVAGAAKGNFTMMDNLGVAMNDTAIAAYAMEKGINKSTSEMSQQEKIGLAMEMFLEKTSYAAGNYAKENATLAGSLGTAKAAMTNFLSGSGDVESLVSSFSNLANVVVKSISEIAPRLTQGISDLVQQVVPLIPPLLNQLLPVIVEGAITLVNGLIAALPGVISAIMQVLPALIDGVLQLITALCAALPQIINPIIQALPQIIEIIMQALPQMIPALINGLVQIIVMLCTMLPQIIQPIIDNLPTIIISIVDALIQNLPVIIQGLISLMMGIVSALPQIIQAIVDALPTIISLVIDGVLSNLPAIIMGLIQVVMGIVSALPQIFSSLISAVPAALSGIWDGISAVFGKLGDWFGEKFSGAKDAAINAWNGAKEKFNKVKENVVGAFNDTKDKVKEKFKAAKEKAQETWSDAKEKWNGIKDKVVSGFSDLKDNIGTKFNESKTNAQQKWSDAKEKFSSVKDKVVSAFSDLKDKVSPLFSKAKDNATKTWSDVKSIFNKFKNKDIVGAFSDLGSLLKKKFSSALDSAKKGFDKIKTIGKDLVTGLWEGINDKFSWLTGKIKSFASGVIDKMKGFFGIKSPARSTRDEVGRWLAEGVAVGIEENTEKVENSAEDMSKKVLDAAKKRLEDYQVYNELTLADEVAFWDSVRWKTQEGTEARLEADKTYFAAKKSLDEKILSAEETLQKSLDETTKKVTDRAKAIHNSFDLFAEADIDDVVDVDTMFSSLDSHINVMETYQERMAVLEEKIGGTALFEELKEKGVSALNQVGQLSYLSDEDLNKYLEKYNKGMELAQQIAKNELGEETIAETKAAYQTFADSMAEIGIEVVEEAEIMKVGAVNHVKEMLKEFKEACESFSVSVKLKGMDVSVDTKTPSFVYGDGTAVEWFDKAMNKPLLMNSPTIFGYNAANGKLMGGGESGSEVVSGTDTLMTMIKGVVAEQNSGLVYYLQKIIDVLAAQFPQLIEAFNVSLAVDGRELAAAMAVPMDEALGKLSSRKDRGR